MTQEMNLFRLIEKGDSTFFITEFEEKDLNQQNAEKRNLLHVAIAHQQKEIASFLIKTGVSLNHQDEKGLSPLHFAAELMALDIAQAILEAGGDPKLTDDYGNSPLWKATFNARGNYKMVRLLLKYGADSQRKNNAERSCLDFAEQIEDLELIQIFQKG